MSEIPEVFAIFEQKLAHVLSFTVVPLKSKDLKNALEEILTYFSGIVERASKAESRIAELEEKQRWIPVSERLPDTKILYDKFDVIVELVGTVNGEVIRHVDLLSYDYRNKSWNDDCGEFGFYPITGVTHWRERPTLPKVQE